MKEYQLCCMSFDGETQIERPIFEDERQAWDYNDKIGSKWYFYPFRFIVTSSHKTIAETCECIPFAKGKRLSTVKRVFERCSKNPDLNNADIFSFAMEVNECLLG